MDRKLKIGRVLSVAAAFFVILAPPPARAEESPDYTHSALAPGTFTLGITLSGFSMDWLFYDDCEGNCTGSRFSLGLGAGVLAARYVMIGGDVSFTSFSEISFIDGGILDFDFGISFLPPLGQRWYLDVGGMGGLTNYFSDNCEGDCSESRSKFGFHAGAGVFLTPRLSLDFLPYYQRISGDFGDDDSFGMKIKLLYFFPHR